MEFYSNPIFRSTLKVYYRSWTQIRLWIGREIWNLPHKLCFRFLNFSAGKYINKGQGKKDSATFIVTLSLLLFFVIFSAGYVIYINYIVSDVNVVVIAIKIRTELNQVPIVIIIKLLVRPMTSWICPFRRWAVGNLWSFVTGHAQNFITVEIGLF